MYHDFMSQQEKKNAANYKMSSILRCILFSEILKSEKNVHLGLLKI